MTHEGDDRYVLGSYWDGVASGMCVGIFLFAFAYLGIHIFAAVIK